MADSVEAAQLEVAAARSTLDQRIGRGLSSAAGAAQLGAETFAGMSLTATLAAQIVALPGVREGTSRFGRSGKAAWFVSGRELAHLHADDRLDLRLPRELQSSIEGDPRAHFRKSQSEWLEFEFHQPQDIEFLVTLVRHAWEAAKKPRPGELKR